MSAPVLGAPMTNGGHASAGPSVLSRAAELVTPAIAAAVRRLNPELRVPVEDHLAGGGKHVRAALVLLSAAAAGGTEEAGLVGAVAIELVHNFSLIHDDIIDEDRERRHRPTTWATFGIGRAIIAGDALSTLATQVLLDDPTPERVAAAAALARATQAMIAGQADDMAFERRTSVTVEECLRMEEGKTGALLSCASSMGAQLVGASAGVVEALARFGSHLGTAFQAVDDMLGIWGEPSVTGKPVGSDLLRRKKSLPVVTALARGNSVATELNALLAGQLDDAAVRRAAQLLDECGVRSEMQALADGNLLKAEQALAGVELSPPPASELLAVARYVAARDR
jgi:geranylgeranyl diphosphate synthase type I